MTGDTIAGLVAAVREHLAPLLLGADAWMRPALMKRLKVALYGNTGAHSAVEMALLDLAGRSAGVPVIDLIGGAVRREVAPMWLVGNATPHQDVAGGEGTRRAGIRSSARRRQTARHRDRHRPAVRKVLGPDH
jgi:muconate cycloisomerase